MARNNYLVGLDIGTKKTVAIIGEITEEQKVEIIGLGVTGSGRQIAGLHAMTEGIVNEIIAHAAAASSTTGKSTLSSRSAARTPSTPSSGRAYLQTMR